MTRVDELTGFPEMLGGRVRTLHPAILAGVLARRDHQEDMDRLAETGILPIDLVVSNLYPFRAVTRRRGVSPEEAIELIDVGGPTLVRAAAKNHAHVGVIVEPDRYDVVLEELQATGGELSPESLRDLAAEAFAHTAGYDAAIARWFAELETFPDRIFIEYVRVRDLPYGENPHQRAAYYVDASARRDVLSRVGQVQGNPLSFNNIADLSAARRLITEFALPSCVIVKHGNPCGAGARRLGRDGLRQRPGLRSAVRLRGRRRAQPSRDRGPGAADHRDVHRDRVRAVLRRGRDRRVRRAREHARPRQPGAAARTSASGTCGACSAAR